MLVFLRFGLIIFANVSWSTTFIVALVSKVALNQYWQTLTLTFGGLWLVTLYRYFSFSTLFSYVVDIACFVDDFAPLLRFDRLSQNG